MVKTAFFYCSCGGSYKGSFSGRSLGFIALLEQQRAAHLALGHSEVNARECAAARRENERRSLRKAHLREEQPQATDGNKPRSRPADAGTDAPSPSTGSAQ